MTSLSLGQTDVRETIRACMFIQNNPDCQLELYTSYGPPVLHFNIFI